MSKRRSPSRYRKNPKTSLFLLLLAALAGLALHFYPGIITLLTGKDDVRVITPADGDLAVHFIDVGQGDATLILSPSGETMLIDTGTSESRSSLPEYLRTYDISTLDYLVLTHPHADHIGSAAAVLDAFTVKHVVMSDAKTDSVTFEKLLIAIDNEGCQVTFPKPEDTFPLGDAVLTVLGPTKSYPKDLNAMSLVLRLDYGSTSFLFTGDAEAASETDMMEFFPASAFAADVLKLGHHGSSTSSSKAFLDAVSPTYAIASCGKDNEYGHPHDEILAAMLERKIALFRTDRDGTVVLASDGKNITILAPSSALE